MFSEQLEVKEYGTWESPIDPEVLTRGAARLSDPLVIAGNAYWLETVPTEQARGTIMRTPLDASLGEPVSLIPAPLNVRTKVNEYGGGSWWGSEDGIYFCEFSDQQVYKLGSEPVRVTNVPHMRFADGSVLPGGGGFIAVAENHAGEGEAATSLVLVSDDGEVTTLVQGSDFYGCPRVSFNGEWLTWMQWQHPNMAWNQTTVCASRFDRSKREVSDITHVTDGTSSATDCNWLRNGLLCYADDRSGWWALYSFDPVDDRTEELLSLEEADIGTPSWVFRLSRWSATRNGIGFVGTKQAMDKLYWRDSNGAVSAIESDLVAVEYIVGSPDEDCLVVIGAGASSPRRISVISAPTGDDTVLSGAKVDTGLGGRVSVAEPMCVEISSNEFVHLFYYPPDSHLYIGPEAQKPPLIVFNHGGPTAHTTAAFSLKVQFWTSRGFAVADINYRGSSGFGRNYRSKLAGQWGVSDVEDSIAVVKELKALGKVNPDQVAIRGGSSGGFTALAVLAASDEFAAGVDLYGVSDLEALASDTHKFESRYLDWLIGPYPESQSVYKERSPINNSERITTPLLILQGDQDEVVPPSQSLEIADALAANDIEHYYVEFAGEQHGFRQPENVVKSLELELWFYGRCFGFTPAGDPAGPESTATSGEYR